MWQAPRCAAAYQLHRHCFPPPRVLQNVLLDSEGRAKVCDFGEFTNM